jgi:putative transposase
VSALRCEFIDAEKTTFGVRRLCRVRAVSRTAYYDWVARDGGPTSREVDEAHAIQGLHQAWAEHPSPGPGDG